MHGIKTLSFKWNRGTSFFFIFSSQVLILDTKLPPCWTLTSDLDIVFPGIHLYDTARYPVFPRSLSKRLIFPNFSGVCLRTPVAFLHQSACKHVIPVRSPFFRDSPDWNILPHPFIVFFIFFLFCSLASQMFGEFLLMTALQKFIPDSCTSDSLSLAANPRVMCRSLKTENRLWNI